MDRLVVALGEENRVKRKNALKKLLSKAESREFDEWTITEFIQPIANKLTDSSEINREITTKILAVLVADEKKYGQIQMDFFPLIIPLLHKRLDRVENIIRITVLYRFFWNKWENDHTVRSWSAECENEIKFDR